ncbi:ferritin-1, chloroplastic-like [Triticum dicoccoides]|uniref:ferritin-1, chloroplastic-like n=1 Tax=Triticum dicoccoides TaxID=85692 RepID=UPI00188DF24B|nr:ferritin-1, chloroplastic-like [Triticum dicoccoides]
MVSPVAASGHPMTAGIRCCSASARGPARPRRGCDLLFMPADPLPQRVECNASYAYHSLYAYFNRDNVALKGFAKFFKESSDEEREHAEMLMEYQNRRGGRVRLLSIVTPLTEFDHSEKGDALYGKFIYGCGCLCIFSS